MKEKEHTAEEVLDFLDFVHTAALNPTKETTWQELLAGGSDSTSLVEATSAV